MEMIDKIILRGKATVVCPECGLEFPVSLLDIANGATITCPAGKFTAHPQDHSKSKNVGVCDSECKTKFEYHTFALDSSKLVEA
jgi:hypothetical protein